VDNGSVDGSPVYIKKEFPLVRLIELKENSGFAEGCNIGIRASGGDYVALLNSDTEVEPQWLEDLYKSASKNETTGMVASKILLDRDTREIDSAGMLIYPDGIGRQRGRGEIDEGQFDKEEETLYPSGCAALYKREMLNEIGLFDKDFFAYCEDTDLGLRGLRAGWKAVLAPKAVVYHKYSGAAGAYSVFKALHVERNRIWVALKNFPLTWLLLAPYFTLKRYIVQAYGIVVARGSASKFRESQPPAVIMSTIVRAYLSAIKGLPMMLKKRMGIKRKISSREFIKLMKRYCISVSELVLKD
jgi:GT2 family glycosyltransferase